MPPSLDDQNKIKDVENDVSSVPNENAIADASNPQNWSQRRKVTIIGLVTFSTLNDALACTIFAPVVSQLLEDFHSPSPTVASLLISIHGIGFVVGLLFLAPLSEIYGRCPLMHVSNGVFLTSALLSALSVNVPMMVVARILMGLAGCVPATMGGGVIADLMPVDKRGMAMAIWASGILLGNVIGPIIGGYMAMNVGWRWTFWMEVIVSGCSAIACIFLMRETYTPLLMRQQSRGSPPQAPRQKQVIWHAIARPTKLLTRSPVVILTSIYNSAAYVYTYFLITTFPRLFTEEYGFNPGQVGLTYIGQGLGFCIAMLTVGVFSDRYTRHRQKLKGAFTPEDRLPPILLGCCCLAIGMICYGWTVKAQTHWIAPIVATGFAGLGIAYLFSSVDLYLVDSYPLYASSAIAANVVVRSILGALLPLAAPELYNRLGYGWGNSLLGFIALTLAPTTLLLYKYGEWLRCHSRFQVNL
ncbi:major facilitator superfamily domain-containing protein [Aspergillus cavernicola]|uniref:Major facilitator superfamily domain-containing protein n=1 Tax=Aspergillus cavernicola TaxID=176166 RepID=A0ABR4HT82_9EURO